MKLIFSILICSLMSLTLLAQKNTLQEVLYLKNGSVIRGKILEQTDDGQIKIEIVGGNILTFTADQVKSIKFEPRTTTVNTQTLPKYKPRIYTPPPYHVPQTGNYQVALLGWVAGRSPNGFRPGFSAHYIYGYRFSQYLSLGLGVGFDVYNLVDNGDGATQFYVDGRGYFKENTQTWYYKLNLGYGSPFTGRWNIQESKGGIYMHPGLGWQFSSRSGTHFIIEFGASFQKAQFIETAWDPVTENMEQIDVENIWYQRNSLKFGILWGTKEKH